MARKVVVACKVCHTEFRDFEGNIGWGMYHHLQACHPEDFKKVKQAQEEIGRLRRMIYNAYGEVWNP